MLRRVCNLPYSLTEPELARRRRTQIADEQMLDHLAPSSREAVPDGITAEVRTCGREGVHVIEDRLRFSANQAADRQERSRGAELVFSNATVLQFQWHVGGKCVAVDLKTKLSGEPAGEEVGIFRTHGRRQACWYGLMLVRVRLLTLQWRIWRDLLLSEVTLALRCSSRCH